MTTTDMVVCLSAVVLGWVTAFIHGAVWENGRFEKRQRQYAADWEQRNKEFFAEMDATRQRIADARRPCACHREDV